MTAIGDSARTIGAADDLAPAQTPLVASTRRRRGPRWLAVLTAFLLTIVCATLLAGAFTVGLARIYDGRIVGGVVIGGVPVGGLDGAAAEARLRAALPSLGTGGLILLADGEQRRVRYADIGRDYDLAGMIAAAFAVGRSAEPVPAVLDELRSLRTGTAVAPRVVYDRGALERLLAMAALSLEHPASDASAVAAPDGSAFVVTPGRDGRAVDVNGVVAAVDARLASPDPTDLTVQLDARPLEPAITTSEVEAAVAAAQLMAAQPLELELGDEALTVKPETLRRWLTLGPTVEGGYRPDFVTSRMRGTVARMAERVRRVPKDAVFVTRGGKTIGFLASVDGRELDADATLERIKSALEARAAGTPTASVELAVHAVSPALTSEEAARVAPRMSRLSGWTTPYVPSEKNFFGKNITIPTNVIDGMILEPGEWFDFWRAIGRVSVDTGYGPGGVIRNGRTDPTGALAGGICSCSTTLFNAAARAGLQLGERHNHWYYITRYPVGLDATVFRSSRAVQNLTFRNDTGHPILIRGFNSYGAVRFEIYGVDTGRRTSFSAPVIRNRVKATDGIQYTSTLPTGTRERIEYPADAFDVWVTRTVRDGSGRIIHQETFFSHYGRVNGIVLVGR